jgi:outer membrane translocation and assembly module TamA
MNNNKKLQFGQTEHIEGMIRGLQRKLEKLAPHPDKNYRLAPLFTQTSHGNVISAAFNRKTLYKTALEAYTRDLPARESLARQIEDLRRALNAPAYTQPAAFPELAIA